MKFWFISDLLDRRARSYESKGSPLEALKLAVPTVVGSVLPIYGPISDILKHIPWAALMLRALVPGILTAVSMYVVSARTAEERTIQLVRDGAVPPTYRYFFSRYSRLFAKFAVFPLLLLSAVEIRSVLPNCITSTDKIRGYICNPGMTAPVPGIPIEAVDEFGQVVSVNEIRTDDTGYFVLLLNPWAQYPTSIRLGGDCSPQVLDFKAARPASQGCGDSLSEPPRRNGRYMWRSKCR